MAESPWGVNIDMDQFTTNVVTDSDHTVSGQGIFDILMNTATQHIAAQYEAGRIRGEDYATTYIQLYQASLAAAVQIWTQKPVAELQRESEAAKKDLYYRQIEGFDESYKQQILKILMDSWAVGFSVARDSFESSQSAGGGIPGPMQKQTIDDFFNNLVLPDAEYFRYGRSDDSVNRGNAPDMETTIKDAKTMQSKMTAVNATVPVANKTAQQVAYNTAMTAKVSETVSEDTQDIPSLDDETVEP